MSQPLDDDLFDDLAEPEGPAHSGMRFDEADALDDPFEPHGFEPHGFEPHGFEPHGFEPHGFEPHGFEPHGADPLDELDEAVEFDVADAMDELEDAVAEALDADDSDEFFGKIFSGLRNVAKKIAPIVSQVAPLLPIPGAGLIGKAADIVSQVAADEADELDAFDAMIDIADEADSFDLAAPVAAALAVRKAVPNVARLPHPQRKQLVKAASVATRHIAQQHGPAAAAAVPAIVRHARRVAVQQGLPARQLPHLVRRTAAKVARSPQLVRRFARASAALRTAPGIAGGMAPGGRGMRRRRRGYGGMSWDEPGMWTAPGIAGGMAPGGRGMRRRRRGYAWGGYGGTRYRGAGRLGRYGYAPRAGGGAWGDRRITLQGPVRITVETI